MFWKSNFSTVLVDSNDPTFNRFSNWVQYFSLQQFKWIFDFLFLSEAFFLAFSAEKIEFDGLSDGGRGKHLNDWDF